MLEDYSEASRKILLIQVRHIGCAAQSPGSCDCSQDLKRLVISYLLERRDPGRSFGSVDV